MLTNLYCKVSTFLTTFKNDERGVTAIEYGLIAAAMAALLSVAFYGSGNFVTELKEVFTNISTVLSGLAEKITKA
ncbi:Flp family type IVb pilin [Vibrio sp. Sgm 22]|uniref:Flp family type IVb pilin n=1 Tax=unclassified Vibrio TaxID=2614977 RepID=UPI00224941F6|nr:MULTISPECIES: Flp family type IVb pilin [unclassified Vibrio]MCX2758860.1 Flp family type IVb pilin [Vibrio sp. 14G-20]MCX2775958.1 Flp family type IVb pilin [Vibrio sp. Sgm 22]